MTGRLVIVGTGPGNPDQTTPEALAAIAGSHVFFGYGPYLDRLTLRGGTWPQLARQKRSAWTKAAEAIFFEAPFSSDSTTVGDSPEIFFSSPA